MLVYAKLKKTFITKLFRKNSVEYLLFQKQIVKINTFGCCE